MSLAPLLFAAALVSPLDHHEKDGTTLTAPPKVGGVVPDFALPALLPDAGTGGEDAMVELSRVLKDGPAVLVVLRGYPGYQCPLCSRQVGSLIGQADAFEKAGVAVVLVYPGPADKLEGFAKEFADKFELPDNFVFLLDPDYQFTSAYHLRWEAPRETAYPSTFVLAPDREVTYAAVSQTHGGRPETAAVLAAAKRAGK